MTTKPTIEIAPLSPPQVMTDDDELDLARHDDDGEGEGDELELIGLLRHRLGISDELPDVSIAASLAAIAAKGDTRGRWLAAFGSPLGRWLAASGRDLNTALNVVLGVAPKPTN
ncbi:MAG: hypothetical protein ACKVP7_20465 [Hyphomicrobiaceae bacterium]